MRRLAILLWGWATGDAAAIIPGSAIFIPVKATKIPVKDCYGNWLATA